VADDLPKRRCCSTFRAWAALTRLQSLSENATVCNSVALALFVTKLQALGSKIIRFVCDKIMGPWLQNHGCKVRRALMMTVDRVFDSHADLTSITVLTWAAMANIKFQGDVILLFSLCCCCHNDARRALAAKAFSATDACGKHELQREVFSVKTKFWPKLHPGGNKTSARSPEV
jgi:hypothetical protein